MTKLINRTHLKRSFAHLYLIKIECKYNKFQCLHQRIIKKNHQNHQSDMTSKNNQTHLRETPSRVTKPPPPPPIRKYSSYQDWQKNKQTHWFSAEMLIVSGFVFHLFRLIPLIHSALHEEGMYADCRLRIGQKQCRWHWIVKGLILGGESIDIGRRKRRFWDAISRLLYLTGFHTVGYW